MTTAAPLPDVRPPAGTLFADDWADDRRVVLGSQRAITDSTAYVSTSAIQHADGRIDDGSTDECPKVYISEQVDLNSDQAREVAALLLQLAAEIDGWVAR